MRPLALCLLTACGGGSGGGERPLAECPAETIVTGDVALANQADASRQRCATRIEGSLAVASSGLVGVDLGILTAVTGGITIDTNSALTSVSLPSLTTVGGQLTVRNNAALTALDVSALTSVGADILIRGNAIATLAAPDLASAGSLELFHLTGTSLELPALTSLPAALQIQESALTTFDLSGLTTIGEDLTIGYNDNLTTLDGLASLTDVGLGLFIDSNPNVPTCEALALRDRVTPTHFYIADNDDAATCN